MSLSDHYRQPRPCISFEVFPPRTEAATQSMWESVAELDRFSPAFYTCTYGAGGSTQTATLEIVTELRSRFGRPVASHLTCVGSSQTELRSYLSEAARRGIDYIVALRGDPPRGSTEFQAVPGGFTHANQLVSLIHQEYPQFGIAVAGYPEVHQEATDMASDLRYLKQKIECGADVVITQLFYVNDDFYRFRERCEAAGIRVPIVPGLLPITNLAQIERITSLCKARLPEALVQQLRASDDPAWQYEVGVRYAQQQAADLCTRGGVPGVHFYVLNKSRATSDVLEATEQLQPMARD